MTIAAYFAECQRMIDEGCFYDNASSRCRSWSIWHGRDCSTFASQAYNAAGGGINPCGTSYSMADLCYDTPRPQWLEELCPGLPGTFITYELAQRLPWWGFKGDDWGRDTSVEGHIESGPGRGKLSVGAHSHATGVHWDDDGLDTHHLSFWAIPPQFLPELEALLKLLAWKVHPQMQEKLYARLKNPQGGWWEGYADGRVDLLRNNGQITHGGMVTPSDKQAFAGRTLARLVLRWYRPKGALRRKAGYTIVATDGATYEPGPQH